MKRVLIVAFAVPPTPGPSPGRAWHLARHLPDRDWEAIVLTPRNPRRRDLFVKTREHRDFPIPLRVVRDPAGRTYWLQETDYRDVAAPRMIPRRRIEEEPSLPGLYGKEILSAEEAALELSPRRRGWFRDPAGALRANPDLRAGWIRPAVAAARAVCEALKIDAVYSVSPPVSAHAIARDVAARAGIRWVADLREPWSGGASGWIDRLNCSRILPSSSRITLPPSFDPLDVPRGGARPEARPEEPSEGRIPVLVHAGPTADRGRSPIPLLDAARVLADSITERPLEFRFRLLGPRDPRIDRAIGERSLGRFVTIESTVPWSVSMETQGKADALLLLLSEQEMNRIPDRLLEAMSAGRPVFALGPPGSWAEKLIREGALGAYETDGDGLARRIAAWLREGAPPAVAPSIDAIAPYRAEAVAAQLAEALEDGR